MELQIIGFWRPSKQALLKFTKWDLWALFENALLNNSVDLGAASYWTPNLISIPHIGFLGQLDTEAEWCPDARDGPCFSPLHRTGVEVSAVANEPSMDHKPPGVVQCRMCSSLDIGKRYPWHPSSAGRGCAVSVPQSCCSRGRVPPTEPRLRAALLHQQQRGHSPARKQAHSTLQRSKNTGQCWTHSPARKQTHQHTGTQQKHRAASLSRCC